MSFLSNQSKYFTRSMKQLGNLAPICIAIEDRRSVPALPAKPGEETTSPIFTRGMKELWSTKRQSYSGTVLLRVAPASPAVPHRWGDPPYSPNDLCLKYITPTVRRKKPKAPKKFLQYFVSYQKSFLQGVFNQNLTKIDLFECLSLLF